jgi:hypothetical protein
MAPSTALDAHFALQHRRRSLSRIVLFVVLRLPHRTIRSRLTTGGVFRDRDDVSAESIGDFATNLVDFVNR